ncbi:RRXRR domain-containing protein [Gloeocapsa sp. PCC 73106]|nr:RRXRR domain-containing protein [Gloeocapsa sp. PCC 73106]
MPTLPSRARRWIKEGKALLSISMDTNGKERLT